MAIDDMVNRTKTYLAGDWSGDKDLIDKLHEWNNNNKLALSFVDVHDATSSSDGSLYCSIKKSLRKRLDITKTFVLVVGSDTNTITAGTCCYCSHYHTWITMSPSCMKGTSIDNRSYVEYECEMALKDYKSGKLKNIVVIYNGLTKPNTSRCPEILRGVGTHIASYCYNAKG